MFHLTNCLIFTGALKPRFSNCSLNTPISEPCREFFDNGCRLIFGLGGVGGAGGDRANRKPSPVISSTAQVARLVAGSLQALGPAAPMARTWNQYCVPLVRPVTVHFDALPT